MGLFNYAATTLCLLRARNILLLSFGLVLVSKSFVNWAALSGPKRAFPVLVSMESFFLVLWFWPTAMNFPRVME